MALTAVITDLHTNFPSCSVSSGIGHFRVAVNLIMKARLSAKFLLRKLVFIHLQTKLIFIRKAFALSPAFIMRFTATRKWTMQLGIEVQITRTTDMNKHDFFNTSFPSCFEPHCESESKCKVFITKISFHSYANKTYFHMKALHLASVS